MALYFTDFLVALGLSLDAFSLSIVYGLNGISNKDSLLLSFIVGIFHFVMPNLGYIVGDIVFNSLNFNLNFVVFFIFCLIGIEMIINCFNNDSINIFSSLVGYFVFGFSVSIDSFTTGIGFNAINNNIVVDSILFMIFSFSLTYIGLVFGNKLSYKFGKYSSFFGGLILISLGIYYLFY